MMGAQEVETGAQEGTAETAGMVDEEAVVGVVEVVAQAVVAVVAALAAVMEGCSVAARAVPAAHSAARPR